MFIMLGDVRISLNYLNDNTACYARENKILHIAFTDDVRIFPVRNIDTWVDNFGIEAVSVDQQQLTITITFCEEKDAIEYTNYLDQYFVR